MAMNVIFIDASRTILKMEMGFTWKKQTIRSETENGFRSEGQKCLQRSPVGGGDAEYAASPGETEQQYEQ